MDLFTSHEVMSATKLNELYLYQSYHSIFSICLLHIYIRDTISAINSSLYYSNTNVLPIYFCSNYKYMYWPNKAAEKNTVQCESKRSPLWFSEIFFPNGWEFLINFFTHLLHNHFYTRVQIFIQISPTLTKLCHTKRDHLAKFYVSLEL